MAQGCWARSSPATPCPGPPGGTPAARSPGVSEGGCGDKAGCQRWLHQFLGSPTPSWPRGVGLSITQPAPFPPDFTVVNNLALSSPSQHVCTPPHWFYWCVWAPRTPPQAPHRHHAPAAGLRTGLWLLGGVLATPQLPVHLCFRLHGRLGAAAGPGLRRRLPLDLLVGGQALLVGTAVGSLRAGGEGGEVLGQDPAPQSRGSMGLPPVLWPTPAESILGAGCPSGSGWKRCTSSHAKVQPGIPCGSCLPFTSSPAGFLGLCPKTCGFPLC